MEKSGVNNNILMLSDSVSGESELSPVTEVVKTVMRKFRKHVHFDRLASVFINESFGNDYAMRILLDEVSSHNAILWGMGNSYENEALYRFCKMLKVYACEYNISGKCIITPFNFYDTYADKTAFEARSRLTAQNAANASRLALSTASNRKKQLAVCADSRRAGLDKLLFRKFEEEAALIRGINTDIYTSEEIIWKYLTFTPNADVIFTGDETARIISMQLCAAQRSSDGYICFHAENKCIYTRAVMPYDEYGNQKSARLLSAAAAMLENELCQKSAALWLRRAVGIANERCLSSDNDEYMSEVIRYISDKMRNKSKKGC